MSGVTMTINGKPATEANIKDALERAMFETAVGALKGKINDAISKEEASQITVNVLGKGIGDLSLNINGPEEIVNRIKAALA